MNEYRYIYSKNKNQSQVPRTNSLDSLLPQNNVYHLAKTTDVFLFFLFFTDASAMQKIN